MKGVFAMSLVVPGGSLQGNAVEDASYFARREIKVLQALGATSADEAAILDRADKIGAGNQDDFAATSEVSRLFQPDAFAKLFPEEQGALQGIWDRFHLGSAGFEEISLPSLGVLEVPGEMKPVDPDRLIPLDDPGIPEALRRTASRVLRAVDSERAPPGLRYAEVKAALEPGSLVTYTPAEAEQLRQLQHVFLCTYLVGEVQPPRVVAPPLGELEHPLQLLPNVVGRIRYRQELLLEQSRSLQASPGAPDLQQVLTSTQNLYLNWTPLTFTAEVPEGHRLVLLTQKAERIFEPGMAELPLDPGPYALELYDAAGKKAADGSYTLPSLAAWVGLADRHYGKPLGSMESGMYERQLVSYEVKDTTPAGAAYSRVRGAASESRVAKWTYVYPGTAEHKGDAEAAGAAFPVPQSALADGAYAFEMPVTYDSGGRKGSARVELEKYPGNLFLVRMGETELWLTPNASQDAELPTLRQKVVLRGTAADAPFDASLGGGKGGLTALFEVESQTLYLTRHAYSRGTQSSWSYAVQPADRRPTAAADKTSPGA